jgi:hypothetical protein
MGFWSSVSSFCSSVVSAVSSIGSTVASFCTSVLPKVIPTLGGPFGGIFLGVANALLTALGVFEPDEDVEKIGDRAIQAKDAGITPEKFDTYGEYMEEIRNFKLDPEKSAQMQSEVKIGAGLAIGTVGLEKKFDVPEGSIGPLWILAASDPKYFTAERLENILKGGGDMGTVVRFFEGKLGPADALDTRQTLMGLERALSPNKSDEVIYAEINLAKDEVRKLDQ